MQMLTIGVTVGLLALATGTTVRAQSDSLTQAERSVKETIEKDGVHIVHLWAPWCGNSMAELNDAWKTVIEANPEVTFTFVTVWNNGNSGRAEMSKAGLPERVEELLLPDHGLSSDKSMRRTSFLGIPFNWIPSTWIFNRNGKLAFAMNYGEMTAATLQQHIDEARRSW